MKLICPGSSADTRPTSRLAEDASRSGRRSRRGAAVYYMIEFYEYILKSLNFEKTYIGQTENLDRRLQEHNSGKSNYTSKFVPWKIIYTEKFNSRKEALVREKYLKSATGRKVVKKLLENTCPGSSADRAAVS